MSTPVAFVTSATGTQGSAVARQLRDIGWTVRATTRDADSQAARTLRAQGVDVVRGSWDDEDVLKRALAGATHLFLNLLPDVVTFTSEVGHAKRILELAKAAGVRHVVYSSSIGVDKDTAPGSAADPQSPSTIASGWKREVEELVKGSGIETWTILRPGFFTHNLLRPKVAMYRGLAETYTWTTAWRPDTRLPLIDAEDIAKFAVAAFRDPARFGGQVIPLASELRTVDEMLAALRQATGKPFRSVYLTDEEAEQRKLEDIFVWVQLSTRHLGDGVDLEAVRSWGIELGTFEQFLAREKEALQETYH